MTMTQELLTRNGLVTALLKWLYFGKYTQALFTVYIYTGHFMSTIQTTIKLI